MGIDQIHVPEAQRAYGYTGNKGTIATPNVYQLVRVLLLLLLLPARSSGRLLADPAFTHAHVNVLAGGGGLGVSELVLWLPRLLAVPSGHGHRPVAHPLRRRLTQRRLRAP